MTYRCHAKCWDVVHLRMGTLGCRGWKSDLCCKSSGRTRSLNSALRGIEKKGENTKSLEFEASFWGRASDAATVAPSRPKKGGNGSRGANCLFIKAERAVLPRRRRRRIARDGRRRSRRAVCPPRLALAPPLPSYPGPYPHPSSYRSTLLSGALFPLSVLFSTITCNFSITVLLTCERILLFQLALLLRLCRFFVEPPTDIALFSNAARVLSAENICRREGKIGFYALRSFSRLRVAIGLQTAFKIMAALE